MEFSCEEGSTKLTTNLGRFWSRQVRRSIVLTLSLTRAVGSYSSRDSGAEKNVFFEGAWTRNH